MSLLARIKKSLGGGTSETPTGERPAAAAPAGAEVATPRVDSSGPIESGPVLEVLRDKIAELSNGQLSAPDVDPGAILFDFGYVDSLTAVNLISFIETEYRVSISELDLVGSLNHLQAVADHIAASLARERTG
jgi:acyl carrier protein